MTPRRTSRSIRLLPGSSRKTVQNDDRSATRDFISLASALFVFVFCVLVPAQHGLARELEYTTTWIGNSFGGGPKWVQNFVEGMKVLPDGTVLVASTWDESGREFGTYKDGDVLGLCNDTHGWGTGGGPSMTATEKYLFIAHSQGNEGGGLKGEPYPPNGKRRFGISRYHRDGTHAPFPGGKGRFGAMVVLHELDEKVDGQAYGLETDGKRLFISDTHGDAVRVCDVETMRETARFEVTKPRRIARDRQGNLWLLCGAGDPVRCYTPAGARVPAALALPAGARPTSLCTDPNGRLLITDNGPSQQVLIYQSEPTGWKLTGRFGEAGGVYAKPSPGKTGPRRFCGPQGVGVDAKGNLYVGCNVPARGAVIRSFTPSGELRWELLNLSFVDIADADPETDGTDVFSTNCRYTLDWNKPVGQQWTWRAYTLDPFRYPHDLRIRTTGSLQCAPEIRHLGGRTFLAVRGMWQRMLCFYRIEGEIAVPCVALSQDHFRAEDGWEPPGQPKAGGWLWRDGNGNGQMESGEYTAAPVPEGEFWASNVDAAGDIWQGSQDGKIFRWRFGGLDRNKTPIYSAKRVTISRIPSPMNHLLRTEYLPETDALYLTGHTKERPMQPGGEWGAVGSEILRFDRWSKGNRAPALRIALPYEPKPDLTFIVSFCTAGELAFAVESRKAKVHVYRLKDGAKIGELTPGPEVHGETGWVDFRDAIRAIRRKNGEYLVFVEEDAKGKTIVYRFVPPAAVGETGTGARIR
jgi:hypothetical protein